MDNVSERARRIVEEIKRLTTTSHYRLVLNQQRIPTVTGSKIGGMPYWPMGKAYPTDGQGNPMLMVMQVNCAEAGLASPLPDHGMLQWFISLNRELMYGCRGNYDDQGEGFRIIYHEEIGESATPADVPTHASVDDMLTPVKSEVAIDFAIEQCDMGVSDGRFNGLFFGIVKDITGSEPIAKQWYQYLDNDDCLYFEQELGMKRPRHQMLGYPVYSQDEARRDVERHDTLLLQLDSQYSDIDGKALVMWGDMGSGFVFVNHEDLAACDFVHAYYCWDCG